MEPAGLKLGQGILYKRFYLVSIRKEQENQITLLLSTLFLFDPAHPKTSGKLLLYTVGRDLSVSKPDEGMIEEIGALIDHLLITLLIDRHTYFVRLFADFAEHKCFVIEKFFCP